MREETRRLENLTLDLYGVKPISLDNYGINDKLSTGSKLRVNIIALGDVGTNVLMGLKLLGGDVIGEIGIFDLNESQLARLEMEFNQMQYPPSPDGPVPNNMPKVSVISEEEIPLSDVIVFCATKGIPEIGVKGDVRMMQLEANRGLVRSIGEKIRKHNEIASDEERFSGLICVVSDPVDQLCMAMAEATGLSPGQVRGFGLGVMAARAYYYASRDDRFSSFITEGRAYGPHGQDLVIANSLDNYDDELSRELTKLTVEANLRVRDLGYKPFLAPAISSGAISILRTLRGEWNYGSVFFGTGDMRGAYIGVLSRLGKNGVEYEDRDLPEAVYSRILNAFVGLTEDEKS